MTWLRKGLVVAGVAGTLACSYWYVVETDQWLSNKSEEARAQALCLKNEFQDTEVKPVPAVENHTHGASAASRSSASFLIQRIAAGVGRKAYFLQGSGADFRAGRAHSREYFWLKDVMCPSSKCKPSGQDILSLIDVDYYVDMPNLLLSRFQAYMLYTFVPSQAAKDAGDYKYRFLDGGEVEYSVSGGGLYQHKLWNWDGDSIRVVKRWLGVPVGYAGYAIERRQMDDDHQLVMLVPLVQGGFLTAWIAMLKLAARECCRFNPVVRDFVRFYVNAKETMQVVTGRVGSFASCSVAASVDSAIASTARTVTGKLTLMSVKSKMDDGRPAEVKNHRGAEMLLEFHLAGLQTRERLSLLDAVRRFQWVSKGAEPDADAKPGMVSFMEPLLDGGFVPDVCLGNEQRFVDKRVREIQAKELALDTFTFGCMESFVKALVPEAHLLSPVDYEEVYARQNRPSQRAILRDAENGKPNHVTKQFMKREAYGSVTDPRGISQINGVDKMEYSRYIYAFSDAVMKPQPWYAFGKTPLEVADRVAGICEGADYVDLTDFSRMDGRISNVARVLEKLAVFRTFHPECHAELYELMKRQSFLQARTTFGIRYETAFQRLSGSPETSAFNTLLSAFIAYYTYRRQFIGHDAAWSTLGIFGGDDGLSSGFRKETATDAAARVGQVLDLNRVRRGDIGVAFLARRYGPDVWYGDNNSCCDLKRQLSKFHLTVHLPSNITREQKLQEKSFAFWLTDANTPVIGEFVTRVLQLFPLKSEFRNVLGIWGVEMAADKRYPNRPADWMHDYARAELQDFDFASYRGWLEGVNGTAVFDPPRFAEPIPADIKPGVVAVDGDLQVVSEPADKPGQSAPPSSESDGKTRFRPRKPKAGKLAIAVKKKK